jgi:hypothetical protein
MSILQTVPQLPSNLQLSQSTGVIIAIGLAVLIIIIAVALVIRARRRSATAQEARTSVDQEAPNTESFEEIATPEAFRETTAIPLSEASEKEVVPPTSDLFHDLHLEEREQMPAPQLPHDTTTIIKGNVNVAAVTASADQAAEIHEELTALSYNEAITPNESVLDQQGLTKKISEVKDDLDSNETLSVILLKCIDIARSLHRRADLKWIHRELFGSVEWDDADYLDVSREEVFPPYRLINATTYVNYTRDGDTYPTIEEYYQIPVFENRSVYALEKILEESNIQNEDYVVLNTPAPAQWPSTASLGELIPLTFSTKDYLDLLAEVRKLTYDFIKSL